jgi:RES domain-containing protein
MKDLRGAATAPPPTLFRVGVRPRAGQFPAKKWLRKPARARFDDPDREFRVLYAAEAVETCWLEVLADFRLAPEMLVEFARLHPRSALCQRLPTKFVEVREVCSLRIKARASFLDLRSRQTRHSVRAVLSQKLVALGLKDFDASDSLSRNRELTQAIARRAYEEGYAGIAYPSRHDPAQGCWAVFERPGTTIVVENQVPVRPTDEALVRVLAEFELALV